MIRKAVAEVQVVLSWVVFLRGSLEPHWAAIIPIWTELLRAAGRDRQIRYRRGAQAQWSNLPDKTTDAQAILDRIDTGAGCRRLELAFGDDRDGAHLELVDLLPVLGEERASYVRMRFPSETQPVDIVRLAEWTIQHLPLSWGAAGLTFEHISGSRFIACRKIAGLAKRNWGVQIQDMSALQWDALRGMPSVNWLTLIGNEFARSKGLSVETLAGDAAQLVQRGIYHRVGTYGIALAAGPKPMLGDINIGEDISAYARVAELIQPLLLTEHTPLAGPFAHPEVLAAWLRRFENPQGWLDCDIAPD
jgi:Protein of unknown function (DUF3396)